MAMVGADLADKIRIDMGFPTPVSAQLVGWGSGVVQHIQTGIVNHTTGTVTGTVPGSGGPLGAGAATAGIISGLTGSGMATLVSAQAGYPGISSELQTYCDEIVDHIQSQGLVEFTAGEITGNCTNSPVSPGALAGGGGTGGEIIGLDGTVLANNIHTAVGYPGGVSTPLIQFCTAITTYIMDNAVVTYAPGSVTGSCPAGGGSLGAGTGIGGTIA